MKKLFYAWLVALAVLALIAVSIAHAQDRPVIKLGDTTLARAAVCSKFISAVNVVKTDAAEGSGPANTLSCENIEQQGFSRLLPIWRVTANESGADG